MHSKIGKFLRIFWMPCQTRQIFLFQRKTISDLCTMHRRINWYHSWNTYCFFWGCPRFEIVLVMMIPLIFDGFLQRLTSYESGNIRRLITGILFGIAFIFAFLYLRRFCIWTAGMILKMFGADPASVEHMIKSLGG